MICVYQRPDLVKVAFVSNTKQRAARGARTYSPEETLFGKRASDVSEGVYDDQGNFLGGFSDYWHHEAQA